MPLLQTDAQCFIFCTGTMVIDIGIEGDMIVVFLIINHSIMKQKYYKDCLMYKKQNGNWMVGPTLGGTTGGLFNETKSNIPPCSGFESIF